MSGTGIDSYGTDPDFVIERSGVTRLLDAWYILRRRDGRRVRITVPLSLRDPDEVMAVARFAADSLPEIPGPTVN